MSNPAYFPVQSDPGARYHTGAGKIQTQEQLQFPQTALNNADETSMALRMGPREVYREVAATVRCHFARNALVPRIMPIKQVERLPNRVELERMIPIQGLANVIGYNTIGNPVSFTNQKFAFTGERAGVSARFSYDLANDDPEMFQITMNQKGGQMLKNMRAYVHTCIMQRMTMLLTTPELILILANKDHQNERDWDAPFIARRKVFGAAQKRNAVRAILSIKTELQRNTGDSPDFILMPARMMQMLRGTLQIEERDISAAAMVKTIIGPGNINTDKVKAAFLGAVGLIGIEMVTPGMGEYGGGVDDPGASLIRYKAEQRFVPLTVTCDQFWPYLDRTSKGRFGSTMPPPTVKAADYAHEKWISIDIISCLRASAREIGLSGSGLSVDGPGGHRGNPIDDLAGARPEDFGGFDPSVHNYHSQFDYIDPAVRGHSRFDESGGTVGGLHAIQGSVIASAEGHLVPNVHFYTSGASEVSLAGPGSLLGYSLWVADEISRPRLGARAREGKLDPQEISRQYIQYFTLACQALANCNYNAALEKAMGGMIQFVDTGEMPTMFVANGYRRPANMGEGRNGIAPSNVASAGMPGASFMTEVDEQWRRTMGVIYFSVVQTGGFELSSWIAKRLYTSFASDDKREAFLGVMNGIASVIQLVAVSLAKTPELLGSIRHILTDDNSRADGGFLGHARSYFMSLRANSAFDRKAVIDQAWASVISEFPTVDRAGEVTVDERPASGRRHAGGSGGDSERDYMFTDMHFTSLGARKTVTTSVRDAVKLFRDSLKRDAITQKGVHRAVAILHGEDAYFTALRDIVSETALSSYTNASLTDSDTAFAAAFMKYINQFSVTEAEIPRHVAHAVRGSDSMGDFGVLVWDGGEGMDTKFPDHISSADSDYPGKGRFDSAVKKIEPKGTKAGLPLFEIDFPIDNFLGYAKSFFKGLLSAEGRTNAWNDVDPANDITWEAFKPRKSLVSGRADEDRWVLFGAMVAFKGCTRKIDANSRDGLVFSVLVWLAMKGITDARFYEEGDVFNIADDEEEGFSSTVTNPVEEILGIKTPLVVKEAFYFGSGEGTSKTEKVLSDPMNKAAFFTAAKLAEIGTVMAQLVHSTPFLGPVAALAAFTRENGDVKFSEDEFHKELEEAVKASGAYEEEDTDGQLFYQGLSGADVEPLQVEAISGNRFDQDRLAEALRHIYEEGTLPGDGNPLVIGLSQNDFYKLESSARSCVVSAFGGCLIALLAPGANVLAIDIESVGSTFRRLHLPPCFGADIMACFVVRTQSAVMGYSPPHQPLGETMITPLKINQQDDGTRMGTVEVHGDVLPWFRYPDNAVILCDIMIMGLLAGGSFVFSQDYKSYLSDVTDMSQIRSVNPTLLTTADERHRVPNAFPIIKLLGENSGDYISVTTSRNTELLRNINRVHSHSLAQSYEYAREGQHTDLFDPQYIEGWTSLPNNAVTFDNERGTFTSRGKMPDPIIGRDVCQVQVTDLNSGGMRYELRGPGCTALEDISAPRCFRDTFQVIETAQTVMPSSFSVEKPIFP